MVETAMNSEKNRRYINDVFAAKDRAAARMAGVAVILALLALALGVMCALLAGQTKIIPYIVQTDKHGYVVTVGPLKSPGAPDERVIISRISEFVQRWRGVVTDPVAQKDLVDWVYSSISVDTPAQNSIGQWYRENDPYLLAKDKFNRTVEISAVMKVSKETYRIEWIETDSIDGETRLKQRWTGLFTIGITPSEDLDKVIRNPLGIYITEFSVSPVFN